MLEVSLSPLRRSNKDDDDESQGGMAENSFFSSLGVAEEDFSELSEGNLLESINFDDLFSGIKDIDGDILPDLEMDHELFSSEFSPLSGGGGDEESDELASSVVTVVNRKPDGIHGGGGGNKPPSIAAAASSSDSGANSGGSSSKGEEIVSKRDESVVVNPLPSSNINKESEKGRKSSSKNHPQGKKKVKKVDWTPELHRRFVQAVELLGVDKAVPSRILEVMGIHCLTRHNIASHLQKYRSHRKHLLAREAEAASWSQRRRMLVGGGGGKREVSPWVAVPTIGFPPMTPPMATRFMPLHVWGHPTMDQSTLMHHIIWPKPSPPPPSWAAPPSQSQPPPSNSDPSYWHQRGPNTLTPGAPCFPQPHLTTTRFGSPTTVSGIPPPHAMYKLDPRQPGPRPLLDFHPSKESVDAAIGDVLSKPWLPLPLGLKAPAIESVMGELHRQGIPKVPTFLSLNY